MSTFNSISELSLVLATSLIAITTLLSYRQELRLEKDILISAFRSVVQLVVVGYVLHFIFGANHPAVTGGVLLVMLSSAAINGGNRGAMIPHAKRIALIGIGTGALITLSILLATKVLSFTPYQMIPVGGMVMSGAMVAVGLCFRQIMTGFEQRKEEVEIKLALGAPPALASQAIIRDALRVSL